MPFDKSGGKLKLAPTREKQEIVGQAFSSCACLIRA